MGEEVELEMKTGRCLTYILNSHSVGFVIASATMERARLNQFGGYCRPHLASMHRGIGWKFTLLRRACKCCFQIHYVRTDSRRWARCMRVAPVLLHESQRKVTTEAYFRLESDSLKLGSTGCFRWLLRVLERLRWAYWGRWKGINSGSTSWSWYGFPMVQSPASVRDSVGAVILGAAVSSLNFTHLDNLFTLQRPQSFSLFAILELCTERFSYMIKVWACMLARVLWDSIQKDCHVS